MHFFFKIELKYKYKYRLVLDETFSFGTVGRTGRGLTELYNVPVRASASSILLSLIYTHPQASKVDMLLGSCATGLASAGGFCAGSRTVVDHQRINGPSFVFSAAMPALLAVSASEGINILRNTPSIFETLQENVRAARAILDKVEVITIPSHPASPVVHIYVKQTPPAQTPPALLSPPSSSSAATMKPQHSNSHSIASVKDTGREAEYELEERLLQEVVEEVLGQGVVVTRAKRLKGQEMVEPRPSIRLALTSALTRKETEKAVGVLKSVLVKVLGRRR